MRKINKDIERKRIPTPPGCICTSKFERALAIVSPSLLMRERLKGNKEVEEYEWEVLKYSNYKRRTRKQQWKAFYRKLREERKEQSE